MIKLTPFAKLLFDALPVGEWYPTNDMNITEQKTIEFFKHQGIVEVRYNRAGGEVRRRTQKEIIDYLQKQNK